MEGAAVIQVQFGAAREQQTERGSDSGQKSQLFPESAGADFAGGRVWRYSLWRIWDERLPYANFLMLNPSIADENQLDPTVTRCADFARRWGYGGLYVTNLFALVSTDPNALYTAEDPVGKDNDRVIVQTARQAGLVVCAWGNHGTHTARRDIVLKLLREAGVSLHYLKMNGTGEPAHPLYLPAALDPKPWA